MPPFVESVIYLEISEVHWHVTPYGIVIYATGAVRVYFAFGDLFETYLHSPGFDPYGIGVPLAQFHEDVAFPPQPAMYEHPPVPNFPRESDPTTPSFYRDQSHSQS